MLQKCKVRPTKSDGSTEPTHEHSQKNPPQNQASESTPPTAPPEQDERGTKAESSLDDFLARQGQSGEDDAVNVDRLLRRFGIRDPLKRKLASSDGITPEIVIETVREVEADDSVRSPYKVAVCRLCERFSVPLRRRGRGGSQSHSRTASRQQRLDQMRAVIQATKDGDHAHIHERPSSQPDEVMV